MKQITIAEAKENFGRCLAEVRAGEEVALMDGERLVAHLSPEEFQKIKPLAVRELTPAQERAREALLQLLRKGVYIGIPSLDRDILYARW
jgi:antitoxin (DNA-binding transcriptional repressor) of toxin-antitoxin stability system